MLHHRIHLYPVVFGRTVTSEPTASSPIFLMKDMPPPVDTSYESGSMKLISLRNIDMDEICGSNKGDNLLLPGSCLLHEWL